MARPWIGSARYLFIPMVVTGTPGYDPPPGGYRQFIQHRVSSDPDPQTSEDRSLLSYIRSISYGRAWIDATVAQPVTLDNLGTDQNPTLLAINAQPDAHEYEYLAVVYPPNRRGAGGGMAQPGRIEFDPPRTPNRTRARCRFRHDAPVGTWAMEVLHNVTDIGDYYSGALDHSRFEEMAGASATHPSAYTKLLAGWLDAGSVAVHPGGRRTYTLHEMARTTQLPAGHVAAVKVQARGSNRYLIVEARTRSDRWERGFTGSAGIPSEGVVVFEFSPETDSWPKDDPHGPWPPLELRTPRALTPGQTFTHFDSSSDTPGVRDHRSGMGRARTLSVQLVAPGRFVVEISTDAPGPRPTHRPDHERPPGTSEQ
jgi:hypothetical protein